MILILNDTLINMPEVLIHQDTYVDFSILKYYVNKITFENDNKLGFYMKKEALIDLLSNQKFISFEIKENLSEIFMDKELLIERIYSVSIAADFNYCMTFMCESVLKNWKYLTLKEINYLLTSSGWTFLFYSILKSTDNPEFNRDLKYLITKMHELKAKEKRVNNVPYCYHCNSIDSKVLYFDGHSFHINSYCERIANNNNFCKCFKNCICNITIPKSG